MLIKSNALAMLLCFVLGAALASSYFLFIGASAPIVQAEVNTANPASSHLSAPTPSAYNNTVVSAPSAVNNQAQRPLAGVNEQHYTQQIVKLTDELAMKTQQLQHNELQLRAAQRHGGDLAQQLGDVFSNEHENSQWSYELETALSDFLITSDLTHQAQLNYLTCKQTTCKFELVAEPHSQQGHIAWRELNDKLALMPWWQQFKLTASSATETHIEFIVSTKE